MQFIDNNGNIRYELNGKLHRLDGPAFIWKNGDGQWYKNGKLHRLDGPAILWKNEIARIEEYWIEGVEYTEQEFLNLSRQIKLKTILNENI
jgi:hypothetical protein